MELKIVDPAAVPDWDARLLRTPGHSFFHTAAWARVLEASYRYRPAYIVGFADKREEAGDAGGRMDVLMPFMTVSSALSGTRGVSLPFTDQCPPLATTPELFRAAFERALEYGKAAGWRYLEWRDAEPWFPKEPPYETYFAHHLDLAPDESDLQAGLNDSHRRNIKKAVKEGVSIVFEPSPDAMEAFCRLNDLTRKRHGLPPQPRSFFRNVRDEILLKGGGVLASAVYQGKIIASLVFFHFGRQAIYKYGASDMAYQSLRANNLVMWEAVRWYKSRDYESLSLGRTEESNEGLR
ncbi:MAG TPA: GNAT family N-acetyltransferase, partial [Acidobacteriota bacterium]|nr:GNAT family N-acetyltransferase [Acidobacteriota bacterium]